MNLLRGFIHSFPKLPASFGVWINARRFHIWTNLRTHGLYWYSEHPFLIDIHVENDRMFSSVIPILWSRDMELFVPLEKKFPS